MQPEAYIQDVGTPSGWPRHSMILNGSVELIITQTPLRVSLAGGGTDFPTFSNSTAVRSQHRDRQVRVLHRQERFDDKIYVNWTKKEIVESV